MKSIFSLLLALCFTLSLDAQVSKTVELSPGNLKTMLTTEELKTITNLTVTGTLDARDFKTMLDDMPVLAVLDMRQATIAAYKGRGGTSYLDSTNYNADAIPPFAFYDISKDVRSNKINLKSVLIPLSARTIGSYAFTACGLTSFSFPSSVRYIQSYAFDDCAGLTSILIPNTVISIGKSAFYQCYGLNSVTITSSIDSIPSSCFMRCGSLITVNIPTSVSYIGSNAFNDCSILRNVSIPSTVTTIAEGAFSNCSSLPSLTLPAGITFLGGFAFSNCINLQGPVILPRGLTAIRAGTFSGCSKLTSVNIPSSVDSIENSAFSDCNSLNELMLPTNLVYIGYYAFSQCRSLKGTLSLPASVEAIKMNAFDGCSSLDSLVIPSAVRSIEGAAFSNCTSLRYIEVNHLFPISLYELTDVFDGIDKTIVTLHVPFGTRERYATAYGWKEFTTIVEGTRGFRLNTPTLNFAVDGGNDSTLNLIADFAWTAAIDQSWLTLNPSSADSSHTITVIAEANHTISSRKGIITLSAAGVPSQTINVFQASVPVKVDLSPGGLNAALTAEEKRTVSHLVITGRINAADFGTIRYQMPLLNILDMKAATIVAYEDPLPFPYYYPENTIPSHTQDEPHHYNFSGLSNLTSVILPSSLVAIGTFMYKGSGPFGGCSGLTSIDIPASVTHIDDASFSGCIGLKSIYLWSDSLYLPPSNPDTMHGSRDVFYGVNKDSCILYVPFGSSFFYKKADQWREFKHIVEMPEWKLSATVVNLEALQGSSTSIKISSAFSWTAISDESWLTVVPSSGSGTQMITITAQANDSIGVRIARITFSAQGIKDQIMTVYQIGAIKAVTSIAGALSSAFNDSERKVISHLVINGTIDARDFKFLRDDMPSLLNLDLSEVKVAAYTGSQGTNGAYSQTYPSDAVPKRAFNIENMNLDRSLLKAVTLPSSITSIEPFSFAGCSKLSFLSIPSSVSFIGDTAFMDCRSLTSVILPSTIHSIGNGTFYFCSKLRSINITESVASIGRVAFSYCNSLSTVTIPSSVTSIESFAFYNCIGLRTIYENSFYPPDLNNTSDVFGEVDKTNCTLMVPYGSKALYAAAWQWKDFVHIVEMPVTKKDGIDNPPQFTCFPNPFTQQVSILIHNTKHIPIVVDICNMAGQKVKNLANGNTSKQLNLFWDGTDDWDQPVPPGIYLCQVNRHTIKLVRR